MKNAVLIVNIILFAGLLDMSLGPKMIVPAQVVQKTISPGDIAIPERHIVRVRIAHKDGYRYLKRDVPKELYEDIKHGDWIPVLQRRGNLLPITYGQKISTENYEQ